MTKDELLAKFQRLGKVLMTPVLILPIAGILQGFGNAFTSPMLLEYAPWLGTPVLAIFFAILKAAAGVVMSNIPLIFAVCLAYGFAKGEKATAALCGLIGYMTLNAVMGTFLTAIGTIDIENLATGQSTILGTVTLDTGVIGGLVVGALVAYLHNRFYKIELPAALSIFNGVRFIPAVTLVGCSVLAIVLALVFPVIQTGLGALSDFIRATGVFGSFVYGAGERLLLPFGLHHFVYLPFFFTSLGGTQVIDGETVSGAVNIYSAILGSAATPFDINVSRFVMNGKVIFAMFGLPGAGLHWSVNFSFRLSLDFHRRFDSENLFNLLMFLPFGFLCPGKRTSSGWLRTAAAGLGLSCAIELLQPFFGRSFDCNDILLNALGALIGAALSGLLARWHAARTRSASL